MSTSATLPDIRVQDEQGNTHVFPGESTPEMIARAMNVKPPAAQGVEPAGPQPNLSGEDYADAVMKARAARKSVMGYFKPMTDAEVRAQLPAEKQQYFDEGKRNFADYLQQKTKEAHQEDYENTLGVIKAAPFLALPELGALADTAMGGEALGAAANVGVQGGGAAGITALEGGNKQQVLDAGLLGSMGPVGDKLATAVAPKAGAAMEDVAGRLYQSALKPPPGSYTTPEVQSMVKTGISEGIPVSQRGADKLSGLISDLNNKVKAQIAAQPGATVNPNAAAQRVDQIIPTFRNQPNAGQDLEALEASKQQFLTEQGAKSAVPPSPPQPTGVLDQYGKPIMTPGTPGQPATPAPPMSAVAAQEMKQGTYTHLSKNYGELSNATVEAQKALARGLKEELETQFPEIGGDNAQLSKMYGLDEALNRAVRRIDNHEIFGLGTRIAATTGAAVGGAAMGAEGAVTGAVASAVLQKAVSDPMVKSKLAIMLSRSSGLPITAANAKVASYIVQLSNAARQPMSPKEALALGAGPVAGVQSQPNP